MGKIARRGISGKPEIRIDASVNEWVLQKQDELKDRVAAGEKVILFPAKVYSAAKTKPGRRIAEYRVRRDGHLKEYVAVAVPENLNLRKGRHGGWIPGSGPKPRLKAARRLKEVVSFKLSSGLVDRAKQLGKDWKTTNALAVDLVAKGLEGAKLGVEEFSPVPQGPGEVLDVVATMRFERKQWDEALQFMQKGESRSAFLRRLFWLGLLLEERKNPPLRGAGFRNP